MLCRALALFAILAPVIGLAADTPPDTARGEALVAEYFRLETDKLTRDTAAELPKLADPVVREEHRRQLREMLGLDPLPERGPLNAVVTGVLEHPEFTVEKLHFQSSPGLYVTGNLYVPVNVKGKVPAILYVCGHALMKKDGVSFGNKAGYQHHGAWFARNGYVCLTIDTLQLGEIEGIHHGLHRENRWWWLARGYTPAGVEAWNSIRALDYLATRPEVDMTKIGVTGRSGGGAYSWWITGIDDRIQVAVPVAGITSLHNHVVDGVIAGHCDCMFQCNTYRWDYAMIPPLFAPKPLLISNTDKDTIFPLDGVLDTHAKTRSVYRALKADNNLGLQITEGPHKDTQELHTHAFVWMNRFLKGESPVIDKPAVKFFEPSQLRVFDELPKDEINTRIDEEFVPKAAKYRIPSDLAGWKSMQERLMQGLREKVFRGWPEHAPTEQALALREVSSAFAGDLKLTRYEFTSQMPYRLPLWIVRKGPAADRPGTRLNLVVADGPTWTTMTAELSRLLSDGALTPEARDAERPSPALLALLNSANSTLAIIAPRGVGPTEWSHDAKIRTHIRRRFALLGQTDDGMRTWDVRCGLRAIRSLDAFRGHEIHLYGEADAAVWSLYACLFEPPVASLTINRFPSHHAEGATLLNVLRVLDVPEALALAASCTQVEMTGLQATDYFNCTVTQSMAKRIKGDVFRLKVEAP